MDVDDIPLGVDFTRYIDEKVGQCEALLAVIGRDWLNATDEEGNRRLEQLGDYVRIELESALKRKIPVVPLLVRRASMPEADELPESIRDFAKNKRHAGQGRSRFSYRLRSIDRGPGKGQNR